MRVHGGGGGVRSPVWARVWIWVCVGTKEVSSMLGRGEAATSVMSSEG